MPHSETKIVATGQSELDQLILKLERSHKSVLRISTKPQSYTYEPNNLESFEKLRNLRMGFRDLARDQVMLFEVIKNGKTIREMLIERLERLQSRFSDLEHELASYLLDLKGYY